MKNAKKYVLVEYDRSIKNKQDFSFKNSFINHNKFYQNQIKSILLNKNLTNSEKIKLLNQLLFKVNANKKNLLQEQEKNESRYFNNFLELLKKNKGKNLISKEDTNDVNSISSEKNYFTPLKFITSEDERFDDYVDVNDDDDHDDDISEKSIDSTLTNFTSSTPIDKYKKSSYTSIIPPTNSLIVDKKNEISKPHISKRSLRPRNLLVDYKKKGGKFFKWNFLKK